MEQTPTLRRDRPFREVLDELAKGDFTEAAREAGPEAVEAAVIAPAEDAINPAHYRKHPSGIECIEVTRHMNFNAGNAIKYIWRYLDKGDPIENLKKAVWYLNDEINRLEKL